MSDLDRYLTDELVEKVRDELAGATIGGGYYATSIAVDEAEELARMALEAAMPDIIRQAKAEAWEEGHAAGCTDPYAKYGECSCGPNPYRADQIEAGR